MPIQGTGLMGASTNIWQTGGDQTSRNVLDWAWAVDPGVRATS